MIQNRNEFRITFQDETERKHLAVSLKQAAADYETPDNPITQITRTRVGVTVDIPDPVTMVDFEAHAAPSRYTVRSGTPVVFEAILADGYTFNGWYKNGVLTASTAIAEITVEGDGAETVVYEARVSAAA